MVLKVCFFTIKKLRGMVYVFSVPVSLVGYPKQKPGAICLPSESSVMSFILKINAAVLCQHVITSTNTCGGASY